MTVGKHSIDELADDTVARIRTVVPAVWGIIVGQIVTWLIGRAWLPAVAAEWQGAVTGASETIVTGLAVLAVYRLAQWVQSGRSPAARLIARILLVVLKAPDYSAGPVRDAARLVIALDGTSDQPAAVERLAAALDPQ